MSDWHIVGRGPSLLTVTADEITGPVITLNAAAEYVRGLNVDVPTFSMFKDGCTAGLPHGTLLGPKHPCSLQPLGTLLLSVMESRNCRPDWAPRIVLDVEGMGLPWYFQSAPVAVAFAIARGAGRIHMLACDAYTNGDTRRVEAGGFIDQDDSGYIEAAHRAIRIAGDAGVELVWR